MLSLKASRFATNRRVLAEAGESIERFVGSGISELGRKLGPIVWQVHAHQGFDAADFEAFLALLPKKVDGLNLRHVLDVRHPSFMSEDYLRLARQHRCATVFCDAPDFPSFADLTGDVVYARLMRSEASRKTGYLPKALDGWAPTRACGLQAGSRPTCRALLHPPKKPPGRATSSCFLSTAPKSGHRLPPARCCSASGSNQSLSRRGAGLPPGCCRVRARCGTPQRYGPCIAGKSPGPGA